MRENYLFIPNEFIYIIEKRINSFFFLPIWLLFNVTYLFIYKCQKSLVQLNWHLLDPLTNLPYKKCQLLKSLIIFFILK